MLQASNKYKTMVEAKTWNAPSPEDEKIMALEAQLKKMKKPKEPNKPNKLGKPSKGAKGQGKGKGQVMSRKASLDDQATPSSRQAQDQNCGWQSLLVVLQAQELGRS